MDGGTARIFTRICFRGDKCDRNEAEPFTTKVKQMDFSKAVKDLKHDPKVTPEEGIRRTVEWMKSIYTSINI
jgi:nucleoside-diphosphate-sugar epimerase